MGKTANREWGGYCIISEGLVLWAHQETPKDLRDYKFYCFNGKVHFCQVISNRHTKETIDFFDENWELQPFTGLLPTAINSELLPTAINSELLPSKPSNYDEMKSIVDKLALNNPFSRIDLYDVNNHVYFGEITFYPFSGMGTFVPVDWNDKLGALIDIKRDN